MVGGRKPSVKRQLLSKVGGWYLVCWLFSQIYKINQGVMVGGRQPSVEDDLRWKTTFGERWPLVEGNLRWKITFSGREPLMENLVCCLFIWLNERMKIIWLHAIFVKEWMSVCKTIPAYESVCTFSPLAPSEVCQNLPSKSSLGQ